MATPVENRSPPRGFDGRIVGTWLGLLLLVVLVFFAWHSGGSRSRDTGATGPWIGLPPGGSDIDDWQSRAIVRQLFAAEATDAALLAGCGHDPAWGRETYIATLFDARGERAGRVTFEVRDDELVTRASGNGGKEAVRTLLRAQLGEVRDAWRVHSLWGDDNGEPLAPGTEWVRLETCIDGHYAVRQHPAGEMGARLHAALERALAAPVADTAASRH